MPKALSPFADEDEKTTIENGWEEEASTTIEQGELAEKIRTLGLRPITNVTGAMDEPTVDDQRANAALSILTPPAVHARLIITAGSDQGQEIEVIPGKSYTIGRAIDNDVVLSDIAVSRKHFDLRFENNVWVLVDRGSGNGTLVNGNIEDNPFMLANGDAIEIGNTTFRFDHPSGVPRASESDFPPTNGFSHTGDIVTRNADAYDGDMEEEPSTVAGKPLRHPEEAQTPQHLAAPLPVISPRPKTVPPPAPLPRTKPPSNMPSSYPLGSALGSVPPIPGNHLPPLQAPLQAPLQPPPIASSPAILGSQPQMLASSPMHGSVPSIGAHRPTMLAQDQIALANVLPTTIPGQGPPMHPSQPQMHALPFAYPNVADHAASQQHVNMHVGSANGRDATSTAHVPPVPYGNLPVMQPYVAPQLSRRTKLLLGGAGLTVLAAIATIAIIKGVSGGGGTEESTERQQTVTPSVQPIEKDKDKVKIATPTPKNSKPGDASTQTKSDGDKKTAQAQKDADDKKAAQAKKDADDKKAAQVKKDADDKKAAQAKKDAEDKKLAQAKKDAEDKKLAQAKKDAEDKKTAQARKAADRKAALQAQRDKIAADRAAKATAKAKADADRAARLKAAADAKRNARPKQVAVAAVDFSAAKEQAKALYQARKFNEAARVLRAAAANTRGAEASFVKNTAASYERFGRAYFNGMTSKNLVTAWAALQQALNYDNTLGNAYTVEINKKRSQIAGQAALALVGVKRYGDALVAIKLGEASGSGDARVARQTLEGEARDLLKQASAQKASDPKSARTKANQVKSMVGRGTPLFNKADKLLASISG